MAHLPATDHDEVGEIEALRRVATRPVAPAEPDDAPLPPGPERRRVHRIARGVLGAALLLFGLWTIHGLLPALVWAAILAVAVWPLYERGERRWPTAPGRHRVWLPAAFTLAIGVAVIVPIALVAVEGAREARQGYAFVQDVRQHGIPVPEALGRLPVGATAATEWWRTNLADPHAADDWLHRLGAGANLGLGGTLGRELLHRAVLFGFTLLALFFLLREGHEVARQMLVASRRLFGRRGERIGRQIVASVHGTVDGLVLVGLAEGFVLGVAYFLCGVPHPVLFGALTAVAAMVPFVAPVLFVLAGVLAMANGFVAGGIVVIVLGSVVVFAADHFVRPALIGGATRLPFLWVLFGILGGVETWGLVGLFLGPAVMAALILLWREFIGQAEPGEVVA